MHRVLGVLHRVVGVVHRVVGVLHRVVGLVHRVLGVPLTPLPRAKGVHMVLEDSQVCSLTKAIQYKHGKHLGSSASPRGRCSRGPPRAPHVAV